MMADEKKNAKKHTKKYGKHRSSGADAALAILRMG